MPDSRLKHRPQLKPWSIPGPIPHVREMAACDYFHGSNPAFKYRHQKKALQKVETGIALRPREEERRWIFDEGVLPEYDMDGARFRLP